MTRTHLGTALASLLAASACTAATNDHRRPWDVTAVSAAVNLDPLVSERSVVPAHANSRVAPFSVLARTSKLTKAPCANCHTVPLASLRWDGSDGRARAHWSIALQHASPDAMTCVTCHDSRDVVRLRTLEGEARSLDHAYEVCGQCHFQERADWEGGAHGKRALGWAPPRVVFSCTECHNPHRPAYDSRWPARAGRSDHREAP